MNDPKKIAEQLRSHSKIFSSTYAGCAVLLAAAQLLEDGQRYPTRDAYLRACSALDSHRERANALEREMGALQRELCELKLALPPGPLFAASADEAWVAIVQAATRRLTTTCCPAREDVIIEQAKEIARIRASVTRAHDCLGDLLK